MADDDQAVRALEQIESHLLGISVTLDRIDDGISNVAAAIWALVPPEPEEQEPVLDRLLDD